MTGMKSMTLQEKYVLFFFDITFEDNLFVSIITVSGIAWAQSLGALTFSLLDSAFFQPPFSGYGTHFRSFASSIIQNSLKKNRYVFSSLVYIHAWAHPFITKYVSSLYWKACICSCDLCDIILLP